MASEVPVHGTVLLEACDDRLYHSDVTWPIYLINQESEEESGTDWVPVSSSRRYLQWPNLLSLGPAPERLHCLPTVLQAGDQFLKTQNQSDLQLASIESPIGILIIPKGAPALLTLLLL